MTPASQSPDIARTYKELGRRLSLHGLLLRGGFHPDAGELALESGKPVATLLLVGHVGSGIWPAFQAARPEGPDPLDHWSREILDEVGTAFGARPAMPSDGPPYWPFQQWAMRAEPVFPSPLGILIHPVYGLWHGYRGALLFEEKLELPAVPVLPAAPALSARNTSMARPMRGFTWRRFSTARGRKRKTAGQRTGRLLFRARPVRALRRSIPAEIPAERPCRPLS